MRGENHGVNVRDSNMDRACGSYCLDGVEMVKYSADSTNCL
jgi:hypothetical protein